MSLLRVWGQPWPGGRQRRSGNERDVSGSWHLVRMGLDGIPGEAWTAWDAVTRTSPSKLEWTRITSSSYWWSNEIFDWLFLHPASVTKICCFKLQRPERDSLRQQIRSALRKGFSFWRGQIFNAPGPSWTLCFQVIYEVPQGRGKPCGHFQSQGPQMRK